MGYRVHCIVSEKGIGGVTKSRQSLVLEYGTSLV